MTLVVPSYSRKLSWAEKHLAHLERCMGEFRDSHPYRARKVVQGQNKGKWVLQFTDKPESEWALMVGDVLYNLRATLDYLAGDLNPSSERSHVMFPIVREPIWEMPFVKGEKRERTDLRNKWDVSTRRMHPKAVAIVKKLQPLPSSALQDGYFHRLDLLNRLSNKDRHRTLLVHITGLTGEITVTFFVQGGLTMTVRQEPDVPAGKVGTAALKDGAVISPPPSVALNSIVDVQIHGTITQAINMGQDGSQVVIPDTLRLILDWIRAEAVTPLSPYLHGLQKG